MALVKLMFFESSYRISVAGEETDDVPYGSPLEAELGGETYLAFADLPENKSNDIETVLDHWVYKVTPLTDSEVEIVDVDGDDDEEGEDGDGDGDNEDPDDEDPDAAEDSERDSVRQRT